MPRVINGEITYLHVLQKEESGPGWVYRAKKKKPWTDCFERAFCKIRLFGTFWCTTSPDCVSKLLGVWEYTVQTYFSYSLNFLSFPNGSSYFSVSVFLLWVSATFLHSDFLGVLYLLLSCCCCWFFFSIRFVLCVLFLCHNLHFYI